MKELVGLVGSNKITTFAYSHQSNGIVERSNKELCRWMEHMLHNGRQPFENWEKALPFAVRIHNSSPIATIRYSPAELLYGDSIVLDKNILLPRANRPADETLSNWSKDRRALQDAMIAQAVKVQRAAQEKRASSPDKQFTAFRNGEHVLIAYPDSAVWKRRQPHKLAMAFKGPYKVLSHEGMVYTLQNLVTNQRVKKLVFHLRPYKYDATRVDPKDMALKDHVGEYYVEQIVSHTGSWKRPTGLRFVVKWVGYPIPEGDQLWKDLRNVKQMHDYMRRIGQGAYIPEMEESDLESDDDSVDNTEHQEEVFDKIVS
jgi:ribosomal protein L21E